MYRARPVRSLPSRSRRSRLAPVVVSLALALGACGGGGDDPVARSDAPAEEPSVELPDGIPADGVTTPWVNGYRLTSETLEPVSTLIPARVRLYRLGADGRSIERFDADGNGEPNGAPRVIHRFDTDGFIVSRENVRPDGTASQTFDSRYDAAGRKTGEQSFNDDVPFLTSDYTYDDAGRLVAQRVTVTANGSLFSERAYTYSADGSLATIRLSSPALSTDLLSEFSFDAATGRPSEIREIDTSTGAVESSESFDYDADGNLVRIERRTASGAVSSTTNFAYEATGDTVPNLPLHEIAHDIDTF